MLVLGIIPILEGRDKENAKKEHRIQNTGDLVIFDLRLAIYDFFFVVLRV